MLQEVTVGGIRPPSTHMIPFPPADLEPSFVFGGLVFLADVSILMLPPRAVVVQPAAITTSPQTLHVVQQNVSARLIRNPPTAAGTYEFLKLFVSNPPALTQVMLACLHQHLDSFVSYSSAF